MAGEKYWPPSVTLPKNVIHDYTINLYCRFLKGHQKNQTMDHLVKCNRRGIVLIRNPYKAIYGHMHLGKKLSRNDVNLGLLNTTLSPNSDCHFRFSVNGKHSLQCEMFQMPVVMLVMLGLSLLRGKVSSFKGLFTGLKMSSYWKN